MSDLHSFPGINSTVAEYRVAVRILRELAIALDRVWQKESWLYRMIFDKPGDQLRKIAQAIEDTLDAK